MSAFANYGSGPLLHHNSNHTVNSGWDDRAVTIYTEELQSLVTLAFSGEDSVTTIQTVPLGSVRYLKHEFMDSINGIPKWELETFQHYLAYLSRSSYLVDFGTWLGPTLMYGAQLVDFALGIEADPAAFAKVSFNLALNKGAWWSKHTTVLAAAVGPENASSHTYMEMHSSSPGNSCSGLGNKSFNCGDIPLDKWKHWNVNAYSLTYIMRHYKVPFTSATFIKVDVESFECSLIPSWRHWLAIIGNHKPTLHVAFHSQIVKCTDDEYLIIGQIASTFGFLSCGADCLGKNGEWILTSGEFVFSDLF